MSVMTKAPVLEIKRMIDAPQARVFSAWMKHEEWQSWIGPEAGRSEVPLFEPHVGGRYRLLMHLQDGRDMEVGGTFRTIEPEHTIAFSWKWADDEHDSLVTVRLRDVGGKTELTLRHEGLLTEENCDAHRGGWNGALNKLVAYLG